MGKFCVLFEKATADNVWLLIIWNVTKATEELIFKFHLIWINTNLNSHVWLLATELDNAAHL